MAYLDLLRVSQGCIQSNSHAVFSSGTCIVFQTNSDNWQNLVTCGCRAEALPQLEAIPLHRQFTTWPTWL